MITVTLQEAKAKLNRLVERAKSGEDIVLMKGSQIVATIVPLSAKDVEVTSTISDLQAQKFWDEIAGQKKKSFKTPHQALKYLKKLS